MAGRLKVTKKYVVAPRKKRKPEYEKMRREVAEYCEDIQTGYKDVNHGEGVILKGYSLWLVLPNVPSVNAMYMTTKYGKRVRTKAAVEWFKQTEDIVREAIGKQGWITTKDKKIVVDIFTYFPDNRRRDTNNSSKALADVLEHAGVYEDDRFALLRYIDWSIDRINPRVECMVRLFDEQQDGWMYNNDTMADFKDGKIDYTPRVTRNKGVSL